MDRESDYLYLERVEKYSQNKSFEYIAFKNIPINFVINESTKIGTRIIFSGLPDYYNLYLTKFHKKGEPQFPYGGITFYNVNDETFISAYYDCVSIHPNNEHIEPYYYSTGQIYFMNYPKPVYSRGEYDKKLLKIKKDKKKFIKEEKIRIKKEKQDLKKIKKKNNKKRVDKNKKSDMVISNERKHTRKRKCSNGRSKSKTGSRKTSEDRINCKKSKQTKRIK